MKVADKIKPAVKEIAVYPAENASVNGMDSESYFNIIENNGKCSVEGGSIKVNGKVYFGISATDQADGSANKNGVNSIELYADNRLIFSILFDKYSYDETRYINSLIDYKKYFNDNVRFVRSEVDEYNILDLYGETSGYVTVKEGDKIEMKYVVKDFNKNTTTVNFTLIGDKPLTEPSGNQYSRSYYRVDGKSEVEVNLDGFTALIPEKAFYRFEYILARQIDTIPNIASDYAYAFGTVEIPVQKNIKVKIRPAAKYASSDKLYVATFDKKGELISQGGKMQDGFVCADVRTLGTFVLAVDNTKPIVSPQNFGNNTKVINCKRLNITIKDAETGINTYDIYLNGKWVIGAYDAKNDLLFYDVDDNLKIGKNKMEIVVTDGVGNETRKVYNIIRESPQK